MLVFPNLISPLVVSYNRHTRFAMVDFPLPVFPKIPKLVPSLIVKLTSFRAVILVSS